MSFKIKKYLKINYRHILKHTRNTLVTIMNYHVFVYAFNSCMSSSRLTLR